MYFKLLSKYAGAYISFIVYIIVAKKLRKEKTTMPYTATDDQEIVLNIRVKDANDTLSVAPTLTVTVDTPAITITSDNNGNYTFRRAQGGNDSVTGNVHANYPILASNGLNYDDTVTFTPGAPVALEVSGTVQTRTA